MARYKLVDRDQVLDAAERVIRNGGLAALTIDAVAKEAGISKGGVQSSIGTKTKLIEAMFERLAGEFDGRIAKLAGDASTPMTGLQAYVAASGHMDKNLGDRTAGMLAALLNSPDQLKRIQRWYQGKSDEFDLASPEGRLARLVFIATEGVFMLRYFGFMKITQREWKQIFLDLQTLLESPETLKHPSGK